MAAVTRTRGGKSASLQRCAASAIAWIALVASSEYVFDIQRASAQMRIGIAAEQYETTFPDTSSQIFGLNGNHRAAIGKIDVPKNADLPIGDGASGCVDDRWPQPGRPDLHA